MANELLNFQKIIDNCNKALTFPEDTSFPPLGKEEEAILFSHKPISIPYGEKRQVFSPLLLEDKKEKKLIYLLFLSGYNIQDSSLFVWNEKEPIFCSLALRTLENSNIDVSGFKASQNLASLAFDIENSIERRGLSSRFSILSVYAFADENILIQNELEGRIRHSQKSGEVPENLSGLFRNIQDNETEKNIDKFIKEGFFSIYRRAWTSLDYYPCVKAACQNEEICSDFLLETLGIENQVGKKIAIVTKDEQELKSVSAFLDAHHLKGCYEKSEIDAPVPSDLKERKERLEEARNRYLRLSRAKKNLFLYPGLDKELSDILFDTILNQSIPYEELDLSMYTDKDFQNDQVYLKRLLSLSTALVDHPIKDHPFYGLSCQRKNSNYDMLILNLIDIRKKLMAFVDSIKEEGLTQLDDRSIECILDFEETGKDIEVLHDYNGFPRRLFKIQNPEDSFLKIKDLKKCYQSVSSTKLLVQNFCKEGIFGEDISSLVKDYKTGVFFVKRKAKKKLLSYLKYDKEALDTVVRVLESYELAKNRLEEILPSYIEVYGDSVSTMNGASEIEANIQYLRKFRMRSNYHPIFRLDNPIVKKALRDHDFRKALYQKYKRTEALYQELKESFNSYIGYFLDGEKNDYNVPFSELLKKTEKQLYASRSDFMEYAYLKEVYQDTSYLLKEAVQKTVKEGGSFYGFIERFLYSLYHTIYNQAEQESLRLDDALYQAMDDYRNEIEKEGELSDLLLKQNLFEGKRNRKEEVLSLLTVKDLVYQNDADLYLILNGNRFSDEELLYLLGKEKRCLFFEQKGEGDKRLFGYPTYSLSHYDLYGYAFDVTRLPKALYEGIVSVSGNLGYEVVRNDVCFPLCLRKKGEQKISYALVPNVLMDEEYYTETESVLREFLYTAYHIELLCFVSFEAGFEKEHILNKIIRKQ